MFWIGAPGPAPMFVGWQEPAGGTTAGLPQLVLIHGGGGQATDWLGTPDGRPGWAPALVARGHRVHVVDRPGHGRGAAWAGALGPMGPAPAIEPLAALFRPDPGAHPTAHLHTQWPAGEPGGPLPEAAADPALAQMLASSRPFPDDLARAHALDGEAVGALLDRIGRCVLITHSAGAPAGWLAAAARPGLVSAIVALEPIGPPHRPAPLALPHGLTAIPLSGLDGLPVLLVTAEASPWRQFDILTRDFLSDAGARVQLLRLADHGVHGNGHGMVLERNHLEVLGVVMDALAALPAG